MATRSAIRRGAFQPVFTVTTTDRQRIAPGPVYLVETNIPDPPATGGDKVQRLSMSIGISL